MTVEQLKHLLVRYGILTRIKKDEVIARDCFFCGNDRWNLELNPVKGVYKCWACLEGGRLDSLLGDQFGVFETIPVLLGDKRDKIRRPDLPELDIPVVPVTEVGSARRYLEERGVTLQEMIRFRIGIVVEEGHAWFGYITFPIRDYWTSEVKGVVGRKMPGLSGVKYMSHVATGVVGGIRNVESTKHVLVEGPLDAIAMARSGTNVAILMGMPKPNVTTEWAAQVPRNHEILIMLDSDAESEAKKLMWLVKQVRSKVNIIQLPEGQDPADLMRRVPC